MGEPGAGSSEQPSTSSAAAASASGGASSSDDIDMSDPALASMTADELKKFIDTGRTGRRNAVSDVSEEVGGGASTSGVAEALGALSVSDKPGTSSSAAGKSS